MKEATLVTWYKCCKVSNQDYIHWLSHFQILILTSHFRGDDNFLSPQISWCDSLFSTFTHMYTFVLVCEQRTLVFVSCHLPCKRWKPYRIYTYTCKHRHDTTTVQWYMSHQHWRGEEAPHCNMCSLSQLPIQIKACSVYGKEWSLTSVVHSPRSFTTAAYMQWITITIYVHNFEGPTY